ncbi:hypothetical protein CTAM01_16899 [Colletotrichum tamarilloi]|uniref:Uncharacterized protein n=1 Tax=Colletotrichum tamarilloi TaxID=1209934 RepID=A0ABQ9QH88_9PEZI|nr:uncharacterized protein CTAM01_16899 [Colletotrichum tamarilloi]KAK1470235.1 hypothetical protein CTAM01_16899 [Colletotrichum tamarilloi]
MPAFQPPKMTYEKNKAWRRIAKPDFHDPKMIWGDYWRRFNTIAVPLLDEDAYFADIIAAAKHAENRGHLEELLAAKHEERRRDLDNFIRDIALSSITSRKHFLSTNTRDAALKIGQTGSMDSFIQFVCGVIFGWSMAEDKQLMRVTTAGDTSTVGNGPDARCDGDARDDVSEDGGDPWEYENIFPPELCSSPGSDEQVDDPWSHTLQRGTICHDTDETTSEHQSQPLSSMIARIDKHITKIANNSKIVIRATLHVAATDRRFHRCRHASLERPWVNHNPLSGTDHVALHVTFLTKALLCPSSGQI